MTPRPGIRSHTVSTLREIAANHAKAVMLAQMESARLSALQAADCQKQRRETAEQIPAHAIAAMIEKPQAQVAHLDYA
jgi:hypothetical protein